MHWVQIIAQNRINEAIENGEFDDLPGKGKPLNLDEYFNCPEADRAANSLLRNANAVPPEVELLKEIEQLENSLSHCSNPVVAEKLSQNLQAKRVSLNYLMEARRKR